MIRAPGFGCCMAYIVAKFFFFLPETVVGAHTQRSLFPADHLAATRKLAWSQQARVPSAAVGSAVASGAVRQGRRHPAVAEEGDHQL